MVMKPCPGVGIGTWSRGMRPAAGAVSSAGPEWIASDTRLDLALIEVVCGVRAYVRAGFLPATDWRSRVGQGRGSLLRGFPSVVEVGLRSLARKIG